MSYNDNFFNYTPKGVGIVIDLGRYDSLRAAKSAIIGLLTSLDDTEDKAVVYSRNEYNNLPDSLGQTVGDVSNYKEFPQYNLESGLIEVLSLINHMDCNSKRFVFYFVDRYTESQARRFDRIVGLSVDFESGIDFVVFDLGEGSSEMARVCQKRNLTLIKISAEKLKADLLKEVIDGKN